MALRFASLSPETRRAYAKEVRAFVEWARQRHLQAATPDDLDAALELYIVQAHAADPSRGRKQRCVCAKAGVVAIAPRLRKLLPATDRSLDGWDSLRPPTQNIPATLNSVLILADHWINLQQRELAVWCVLSHAALLRVSEAEALRVHDVTLPSDLQPAAVLHLSSTKARRPQSVVVDSPLAIALLRQQVSRRDPGQRVFTATARQFSKALRTACTTLALPHFTPHSLRHGGATDLWLAGVDVATILERGRWASSSTMRNYLQASRAAHLNAGLPPALRDKARQLRRDPLALAAHQ